ncbi:MAG: cell division protein FtsL [Oribacterium sp.]|nr:cell division protein FtsL [Oribacterium sp.]
MARSTARTAGKVHTFVDGNTVRKELPQIQKPRRSPGTKRKTGKKQHTYMQLDRQRILSEREMDHRAQQERLRGKAVSVDAPFLFVLIAASLCTLALCFNYIQLQTSINYRMSSIEQKKQQLEQLKSENDALQSSIDTAVDLNEIYRIATQELGMVYAGNDQVITYNKTESEYVRQYEDIPEYK